MRMHIVNRIKESKIRSQISKRIYFELVFCTEKATDFVIYMTKEEKKKNKHTDDLKCMAN